MTMIHNFEQCRPQQVEDHDLGGFGLGRRLNEGFPLVVALDADARGDIQLLNIFCYKYRWIQRKNI